MHFDPLEEPRHVAYTEEKLDSVCYVYVYEASSVAKLGDTNVLVF